MPNANIKTPRGLLKAWLACALAFTLALGACVYLYFDSKARLNVIAPMDYGSSLQNSKLTSSHDLGYVFLGTRHNDIIAIDSQGEEAWRFPAEGAVRGVEYVQSGNLLIACTNNNRMVYILNAEDGAKLFAVQAAGNLNGMAVDEASGRILVAGKSAQRSLGAGFLAVYDMQGALINEIYTRREATSCAFALGAESLFYGDTSAGIHNIDYTGEVIAETNMRKEIKGLDVARDTGYVTVITDACEIALFDDKLNTVFSLMHNARGTAISITADGNMISAGTKEGDVYLIDAKGVQQYYTRLPYEISQVVIGDEQSFVVPLSNTLYSLDMTSAAQFPALMRTRDVCYILIYALSALMLLAYILSFPASRKRFFAFMRSAYRHRTAYLLLVPSFALIIIFNYVPIGQAFYYAFTDWDMANSSSMRAVKFIGFDNFVKMIDEGYFLLGVKNMLIIMGFSFLKLLMPLIIAELVFAVGGNRAKYWYRFLLVLPMVVPGVVSTLMWRQIYDPATGLINKVFELLGKTDWQRAWLGNERTALGAIIFMGFPWVNSFAFLVFYGGLLNIPGDLFEAARVDGSNPAWNLFKIHLPLISPQIKMIIILTFISAIQDYSAVLLLTDGGPGYATYVPGFELYMNATRLGEYGYACALGLVMFLVILAGTFANLKIKTEDTLG